MKIYCSDFDHWIQTIYALVLKGLTFDATLEGTIYQIELTGGY